MQGCIPGIRLSREMLTLGSDQVDGKFFPVLWSTPDIGSVFCFWRGCDLDMGSVMPTVLEFIIDRFMLWDVLIVACEAPMRSKRSGALEGAWAV